MAHKGAFSVVQAAGNTIDIPIGSGAGAAIAVGDILIVDAVWANRGSITCGLSYTGGTPTTAPVWRAAFSEPATAGSVAQGVFTWVVESGITNIRLTFSGATDNGNALVIHGDNMVSLHTHASPAWSASTVTGSPTQYSSPTVSSVPAGAVLYAGVEMASGAEVVTLATGSGTVLLDGTERNGFIGMWTQPSTGTAAAKTFEWNNSGAYRARAWQIGVLYAPAPTVNYAIVSDPREDGFTVSGSFANTVQARLKVGTNSAVTTGVLYGSWETPDAYTWAKSRFTGGTADTKYWYRWEMEDSGGNITLSAVLGAPTTMPVEGSPTNAKIAFGSCDDVSTGGTPSYARLYAQAPRLFVHVGDFHYADSNSTSVATHIGYLTGAMDASSDLRTLLANVPTIYIPSDHDTTGNNAYPSAGTAANYTGRMALFAYPNQPDPDSVYSSMIFGRYRLIFLDTRRYAVEGGSRLGAPQLAWFRSELAQPEPVKIFFEDNPWIDNRTADPGDDTWPAMPADRNTIRDDIANGDTVGQIIVAHGDQHCLAADDGSHNAWGGFPSFSAAPFRNTTSLKTLNYSDWSEGVYPNPVGATPQSMYGLISPTDTGSSITTAYDGFDTTNTIRVQQDVVTATLTRVTKTAGIAWNTAARVSKPQSSTWNTHARVGKAQSSTWHALSRATKTQQSLWIALARVAKGQSSAWNAAARVGKTQGIEWQTATRITKSQVVWWNTEAALSRVTATYPTAWHTASRVSRSAALEWSTLARAAKTQQAAWTVLSRTGKTQSVAWSINSRAVTAQAVWWNVATDSGRVLVTFPLAWNTAQRVVKTQPALWATLDRETLTRALAWTVLTRAALVRATAWDTERRVILIRPTAWNVDSELVLPPIPSHRTLTQGERRTLVGGTRRTLNGGT